MTITILLPTINNETYMKKLLSAITLSLCAFGGVQAQLVGGCWYNGTIEYFAEKTEDGQFVMNGMDEGEERSFTMIPVAGKANTYRFTDTDYDYRDVTTAKQIKKEGVDVLAFYDNKNQLRKILENVADAGKSYERITIGRWKEQLMGTYFFPEGGSGEDLVWGEKAIVVNHVVAPYEVVVFNGRVTGYIHVKDSGTVLDGTWEVIPTLEGIHLYEINENGDYLYEWERGSVEYTLKENNPNVGRFDYANRTLLTSQHFRGYKKSTLRIMRNAILARKGYRFQSKDLQDYFGKEPWYKPAASNDNVKLSFIEQLNVELIKAEEENPNHDVFQKEP